jgi:hypothetical protein
MHGHMNVKWRQPVVSNIGTHWPDCSVSCCCTVAILLCYVLLLLCICLYIRIVCIFILACRLILWLEISLITPLSLARIVIFRVHFTKCTNSLILLCPWTLCRHFQSLVMFLFIQSSTSCFYSQYSVCTLLDLLYIITLNNLTVILRVLKLTAVATVT